MARHCMVARAARAVSPASCGRSGARTLQTQIDMDFLSAIGITRQAEHVGVRPLGQWSARARAAASLTVRAFLIPLRCERYSQAGAVQAAGTYWCFAAEPVNCARHRLSATTAQIPSTIPNGHAPWRKPYTDPSTHAAAKPSTNHGLLRSNA